MHPYNNFVPQRSFSVPFILKSNVPVDTTNDDILKMLPQVQGHISSPSSNDFNTFPSQPQSPNQFTNSAIVPPTDVLPNFQMPFQIPSEPLINKQPSSRALKAKRCPTNKCECGGKPGCSNPECKRSIGCHQCPVCGLEFSRKNSMRRHVLTHINLRPYRCEDCDKSFYRSDIYKRHLVSKRCRKNVTNNQFLSLCQQLPGVQVQNRFPFHPNI